MMNVDGIPNVRACVEPVRDGTQVSSQNAWPSIDRDVLNVFDYYNYADYLVNWGGNSAFNSNPVSYNPTGNISGVPRTFKMTMGVKF